MILSPKRQFRNLFPLAALLFLLAIAFIGYNGSHNVYYAWTDDPNGMFPCNDNGNNFWLGMFIEWASGGPAGQPHMMLGACHIQRVIPADKLDQLIEQALQKKNLTSKTATSDQYNAAMNQVLRKLAQDALR